MAQGKGIKADQAQQVQWPTWWPLLLPASQGPGHHAQSGQHGADVSAEISKEKQLHNFEPDVKQALIKQ